jgi:DivIVA domain-containing protein
MPISVKEIHEKEFSRQVRGYNIDEVDDFLDEIASQLELLIRENRALTQQLSSRPEVPVQVVTTPAQVVPAPLPPVSAPVQVSAKPEPVPIAASADESKYFKNLEAALRETLISAQRIADETVTDARKKANSMVASAEDKANKLLSSAEEQAASITSSCNAEAALIRAENEDVRKAAEDYRSRFIRLVEEQMRAIKADHKLFD